MSFSVKLKKLIVFGRKYPWPKPKQCPNCNGCRIWGHGFVPAWFDDFNQAIEIKRCRCPDCSGFDSTLRKHPDFYHSRQICQGVMFSASAKKMIENSINYHRQRLEKELEIIPSNY